MFMVQIKLVDLHHKLLVKLTNPTKCLGTVYFRSWSHDVATMTI